MKAVILAAGKGTRMRDLTKALPKPMLKVQDKPILQHIIEGLIANDIREICVITGFQAAIIEDFFRDGKSVGARISYVRQEVQDGTGKAPELAKAFVGSDSFVLTYGDILVRPQTYEQMIARFENGKYDGVVTVTPGEDVSKGGLNFFDDDFCLRRIVEKPGPAQVEEYRAKGWLKQGGPVWYNAGIYLFKPSIFQFTAKLQKSARGEYELPDAINSMIDAKHKVAGLEIVGRWVDVRDPEVLAKLEDGWEGSSLADLSYTRAPFLDNSTLPNLFRIFYPR